MGNLGGVDAAPIPGARRDVCQWVLPSDRISGPPGRRAGTADYFGRISPFRTQTPRSSHCRSSLPLNRY